MCGAPARRDRKLQASWAGRRRPAGLPGTGRGGVAPVPSRREAQARGVEGPRRCGDVLEEKNKQEEKKNPQKIYMGEMNFFFIEPSAMHQRVFLSLYVKRLLRKVLFLL